MFLLALAHAAVLKAVVPLLKKRDGGTYKQHADQTLNEYILKKLINVDNLGIFDPFICA